MQKQSNLHEPMQDTEEWEQEFDSKFVVRTGTKKVKRVGFWLQKSSEFPTCYSDEDIKSFIRSLLAKTREETIEQIDAITKDYEVSVAPQLKAEQLGIPVALAVKISQFHKVRWAEFREELSKLKSSLGEKEEK